MKIKDLLQNLIWPAVAGNVSWSFFTVLVSEPIQFPDVCGRLTALFLLSVYLLITYIKSNKEGYEENMFDIFYSIMIVLCAVSINAKSKYMEIILIALFMVSAIGHWTGRWMPSTVATTKKGIRKALVGSINLSGAVICLGLRKMDYNLNLSISMATVLVLWLLFRDWIYCKWK